MSPYAPLLGPDFETMDCARFLMHVSSLRMERKSKQVQEKLKSLRGRWTVKATCTRFGTFQLEYEGALYDLMAPKDRTTTPELFEEALAQLKCTREALSALLTAKGFVVRALDGGPL